MKKALVVKAKNGYTPSEYFFGLQKIKSIRKIVDDTLYKIIDENINLVGALNDKFGYCYTEKWGVKCYGFSHCWVLIIEE